MTIRKHTIHRMLLLATGILFLTLWQLANAENLRTTDYFLSHKSIEPFYKDNGLNDNVTLHVREVIQPGREREVIKDGKVLLFLHGATFPGYVAFDLDYKNVSMMRNFARLGWDTFTMDLEGYGMSTRPPVMDEPEKYPHRKAPVSIDVTLADVERVVDFIRDLRGVKKVHILGWSAGGKAEAPHYAIKHPDKVSSLIIYAANYRDHKNRSSEELKQADVKRNAQKNRMGDPGNVKRWEKLGTPEDFLIPGAFDAYSKAHRASDPKSEALEGKIRAPWGRFVGWTQPHFDASAITVPTLVIRGETDKIASREDNQKLVEALGSKVKKYVEIKNAGHMIHFEKTNEEFYQALQEFLETLFDTVYGD